MRERGVHQKQLLGHSQLLIPNNDAIRREIS